MRRTLPLVCQSSRCAFTSASIAAGSEYVWPLEIGFFPDLQRLSRTLSSLSKASLKSFRPDRKSTRLNSSHQIISYPVFCLKKQHIQAQYQRHAIPSARTESRMQNLY